jgi:tetratricopeptide (TPR) repeat protein
MKLCNKCFSAVRETDIVCPKCGAVLKVQEKKQKKIPEKDLDWMEKPIVLRDTLEPSDSSQSTQVSETKKDDEDDAYICNNCGAKVDPNRNICMRCGTFNNPIQKFLAKKMFDEQGGYVLLQVSNSPHAQKDPNYPYSEGLELLEKMKLNDALLYFKKMTKSNPGDIALWNNYGVAYMGLKNRRDALKCYEKALELNPNYYIGIYNKGAVYFECKQYRKAITYYDKTLEINPKCAEAYQDRTIAYENLGELRLGDSFKATSLGLNTARAMMNKSSALIDLGNGKDNILGSIDKIYKNEREVQALFNKGQDATRNGRFSDAINYFERAIGLNPVISAPRLSLGGILAKMGKKEEALISLNKATELDPNVLFAWVVKAGFLGQIGKFKEALSCFDEALRINPFDKMAMNGRDLVSKELSKIDDDYRIEGKPYEDWLEKGHDLVKKGEFEEALKCYEEGLKLSKTSIDLWLDSGLALNQLKRFNEAINKFEKAIELNEDSNEAWTYKGIALGGLKKLEDSLVCYDNALGINPEYEYALFNKAATLVNLKRFEEAIEHFDKLIEINPDFAQAKEIREKAFQQKHLVRIAEDLKSRPKEAVDLSNKGIELMQQGRLKEAIDYFDKTLAIDPSFAEILSMKGMVLQTMGRLDEALECYTNAIDINPEILDAYNNMGIILKNQGKYKEAIECYDKALKVCPDVNAWQNKGNAYYLMGKSEIALKCFEEVLKLDPNHSVALNAKNRLLEELGTLERPSDTIMARSPTSATPEYCTQCGTKIKPNHKFCGECGSPV